MKTIKQLEQKLTPLFDEADRVCPGILSDFQLSEGYQIELHLTVKEVRDMKELFDARLRARMAAEEFLVFGPKSRSKKAEVKS